jgi:hypothetical protein
MFLDEYLGPYAREDGTPGRSGNTYPQLPGTWPMGPRGRVSEAGRLIGVPRASGFGTVYTLLGAMGFLPRAQVVKMA